MFQPGAWLAAGDRTLPPELETFLEAGEPPVYFGFGSMRVTEGLSHALIQAARAIGRRSIVSRGWTDLAPVDEHRDCLSVGEIDHHALFPRVAAVVHHGGAGTTTAAALAGAPQVVLPHDYDQHYWAQRVNHLGIGAACPPDAPTTAALTDMLLTVLDPRVTAEAGPSPTGSGPTAHSRPQSACSPSSANDARDSGIRRAVNHERASTTCPVARQAPLRDNWSYLFVRPHASGVRS